MTTVSKREFSVEKKNTYKEVPQIWESNPSYKHSNLSFIIPRIIIVATICIFFTTISYLLTTTLSIALGIGSVILILFILSFSDKTPQLFSLFRRTCPVNPFKHVEFFMEHETSSTLFLTNTNDNRHLGLKIFKIVVIPESVHENLNFFIKSLSEYKNMISFTYQIIQSPFIHDNAPLEKRPIQTSIYFCVYHTASGTLRPLKFRRLQDALRKLEGVLKSSFVSNFHHYQIMLLNGTNLINALRTYFFRTTHINTSEKRVTTIPKPVITIPFLMRSTVLAILSFLMFIFLTTLHIPVFYSVLIDGGIVISIIFLWWRELLFILSGRRTLSRNGLIPINPFFDTRFFRFQGLSDTLFAFIDDRIVVGIKMYNLVYAFPPSYCHPDKFILGIMNQKISFGYTCMNSPIDYQTFYKKGLDYLNEKTRFSLLHSNWRVQSRIDEINWLARRAGIWKTIFTLSASEFEVVDSLSEEVILSLEERLELKAQILYNTFNTNFLNYRLIQLQRGKLRSGIRCELVKSPYVFIKGCDLNYILFQGKALRDLTKVVAELKKGITTKIPSEFNTPLWLENQFTLGHTINTEVHEEEMPFGFTHEQVRNLILLNGMYTSRNSLAMKIVAELVESNTPSLIFDFNGNWSKIIAYFKGTRFADDFLYFKLGRAFSLDLLASDIPYDKDNVNFMNLMFDAYSLAFKKNQRIIDFMRGTIINNPEMDMTSLNLKLINQNPWEKAPGSDSLISLFSDFTQQDEQYLRISTSGSTSEITFHQFINTNKTVIIDLSISDSYVKQIFLVFLILSKIIHYLSSAEKKQCIPKMLVIPHIDLMFESYWLDKRSDYGKINEFLDPLVEKGFGFLFMANQAHYLHHNLLNYFSNIIAFQARDNQDIAALSSLMNLQELQGTGYYSSTRNQTYQINYLKSMKNDEAIVKRSDTQQSFPVRLDWNDITKNDLLREDEIIEYMGKQGFNLKDTEQKILDEVKKNLFQKDLGIYKSFTNEVKQFLASMSTIDQVGTLYEKKLKKELKTIIYPKASKIFKNKVDIKKSRDDIFNILVKHGYLVENHPKTAGGSESIRTSYSVGAQYQKALEDEFASNQPYIVEPVDEESEIPFTYPDEAHTIPRRYIIQSHNLKKAIAREYSNFFFELFTAEEFISKGQYSEALKIEHDLIARFLTELCKHYNNVNQVSPANLDTFIELISSDPSLNVTNEELKGFAEKYQQIDFGSEDYEQMVNELHHHILAFFKLIKAYHFEEEE